MSPRDQGPQGTYDPLYPQIEPLNNSNRGYNGPQASPHNQQYYSSQGPGSRFPPIPTLAEDASAPPLQHHHASPSAPPLPQPPAGPGVALIAAPKIEAQPWVRDLWRTLAATTVGVIRFDLRRPVFPAADEYDPSNILVKKGYRRGRGRPRKQPQAIVNSPYGGPYGAGGAYNSPYGVYDNYYNQNAAAAAAAVGEPGQRFGERLFTGARLKLMRCLQIKSDEGTVPLLDLGIGAGLDVNAQRLHFITRLKVANLFTVKFLPQPVVKLGHTWQLPGTGVALRVRYECPLNNLDRLWQPPARLMLRLDNDVGTGIHLSPGGVEFDERRLALGKNTEVRMGATLRFPRALPLEPDDTDAFKLDVHRLSLRSLW